MNNRTRRTNLISGSDIDAEDLFDRGGIPRSLPNPASDKKENVRSMARKWSGHTSSRLGFGNGVEEGWIFLSVNRQFDGKNWENPLERLNGK